MGRVVLVCRLAARDLRRRPVEAALLLLVIAAAGATLSLSLLLRQVATEPYERTREATEGPDVVAGIGADPAANGVLASELAALEGLANAPDVVASSGPLPVAEAELRVDGLVVTALVEGRATTAAAVDRPAATQGRWVSEGSAVVEAAFADALGIEEGDAITLDGRSFQVAGVAVTAAVSPYPDMPCLAGMCIPAGLVWLTEADLYGLVAGQPRAYVSHLALTDPDAAPTFVETQLSRPGQPMGTAWQEIRDDTTHLVTNQRRVLMAGSSLLAILGVAGVAVLVGARSAEQTRRVGLLKAIGGTPGLAATVLLTEYAIVAVVAAAAGAALGWLTAPLLIEPSAGLVGAIGMPPLTLSTVALVIGVSLGVAALATFVPALRSSRTSTVLALGDSARPPGRVAWLIAASRRLPAPLLVGLRVAARRPRRAVLAVASVTVTVSGIVAALAAHADAKTSSMSETFGADPRSDRLDQVLLVVSITLVALAAVNAVVITRAAAIDARHTSAVTRALGATAGAVSAGLAAAQVLPALIGALLGIPGGLALLAVVDPDETTIPPPWQLLAVVLGSVAMIAALTASPARLGARRAVAPTLQAELA